MEAELAEIQNAKLASATGGATGFEVEGDEKQKVKYQVMLEKQG